MYKRIIVFTIVLMMLSSIQFTTAQENENAQLRVIQLSYISEGSAVADVMIDDTPIGQNISFPFSTNYAEIAAGDHTVTATIVDHSDATASTDLLLEAGHRYTLIVDGDYNTDAVTFTLIDESTLLADITGSAAVLVNLTENPLDGYLDDQISLENIVSGEYGVASLPMTEAEIVLTIADNPDEVVYTTDYMPFSNTIVFGVARSTTSGEVQVIVDRRSDLTVAEYLTSIEEGTIFASMADIFNTVDIAASLPDEGEYTLFLPTDEVVDDLSANIPSDPDVLSDFVLNHVITQNVPPTVLRNHNFLMTLTDHTLSLEFEDTNSGYWEINDAPILWDIRLANGTIYAIAGIIIPAN